MGEKMKEYIFDEANGLWYQRCGDYYIPCLTLDDGEDYQIGKYGRMHRSFLRERMDTICATMKKQEGVTEALKAADQKR